MALTPEQIQEIRDLRLNGKKQPKEIIAFFKEKGVEVKGWEVSYHCRPVGKATGKKAPARKPAVGGAPIVQGDPDKIKALVDQLRAELDAYAGYVIRKIRVELIKAVAAARQKRIEAGEDLEAIREEELLEA